MHARQRRSAAGLQGSHIARVGRILLRALGPGHRGEPVEVHELQSSVLLNSGQWPVSSPASACPCDVLGNASPLGSANGLEDRHHAHPFNLNKLGTRLGGKWHDRRWTLHGVSSIMRWRDATSGLMNVLLIAVFSS